MVSLGPRAQSRMDKWFDTVSRGWKEYPFHSTVVLDYRVLVFGILVVRPLPAWEDH